MDANTKKHGALFMVLMAIWLLCMLGGCSVFISTPRVTRIQVQGLDDHLREYIVTLDEPAENRAGIQISDRYSIQFDFEWLWNSAGDADIYYDPNAKNDDPAMAPWMLCKYRF